MPLLATLVASIAGGLASLLSVIMGYQLALKLAAYTVWITITGIFVTSTFACITAMWSMMVGYFGGGGGMHTLSGALAMGLSVIVPSNAATVMACCQSVWIATQVYKLQKQGLINFGS